MPDGDLGADLEEEVQHAWFKGETLSFLPVSNVYIAAHTGPPGDDGTDNEVDASDYSRAETDPDDWDVLSGNNPTVVENGAEIQFSTADSDWGEVSWLSFWSEESGGSHGWNLELDEPSEIGNNQRLIFEEGELEFSLG